MTKLSQGNKALRDKDYQQAVAFYIEALTANSELSKAIVPNITMAQQKFTLSREENKVKQRVAVCGWTLSDNVERICTLAKLYGTFAEVEIIGTLFPKYGTQVSESIRDISMPIHSFVVDDEGLFLEQALKLVIHHPFDVVHLSQPKIPNIFFGLLYKLIWNAKVLVDIDDKFSTELAISIDKYIKENGSLPELKDLNGVDWTHLAVGLVNEFDGITVSDAILHKHYGGEIIHNEQDNKKSSSELIAVLQKTLDNTKQPIPQKVIPLLALFYSVKGLISLIDKGTTRESIMGSSCLPVIQNNSLTSSIDKEITIIKKSGFFDIEYYKLRNSDLAKSKICLIEHFCKFGWKELRDPAPFFNTSYYLNKHPDIKESLSNPLVHFINHGYKEGRSSVSEYNFLRAKADITKLNNSLQHNFKIAIILHLYYMDLADNIALYLKNIDQDFSLYITTKKHCRKFLYDKFINFFPNKKIVVTEVENRGRDIAPFLTEFSQICQNYDVVCKIHGKKSKHSSALDIWRTHLLDNLLGTKDIIRTILNSFESDESLGIVYPVLTSHLKIALKIDSCWGHNQDNYNISKDLRTLLGILSNPSNEFSFPVGSMFWFRPVAIEQILNSDLKMIDFCPEKGQVDGTLAHAIERLFGLITTKNNFSIKSVYLNWNNNPSLNNLSKKYITNLPFNTSGFTKVLHFKIQKINPPEKTFNSKKLNIHWVVPNFNIGNGGHMTIFRIIYFLEKLGHKNTIWIHSLKKKNKQAFHHQKTIRDHYQKLNASIYYLGDTSEEVNKISGDVLIATDRMSAYPVTNMQHFHSRFYFIQDYECNFFPVGTEYFLTKNTYNMGLDCLCASEWLYKILSQQHKQWAMAWSLAVDHTIYYEKQSKNRNQKLIAFYSRSSTPRRLVELGFLALNELYFRGLNFKVCLFGENTKTINVPYSVNNMGILNSAELANLYNEAYVGLVFSGTNYSLIPNEMMACGLPMVDIMEENTLLAFPKGTACLAKPEPDQIANMLEKLLVDDVFWGKHRVNGLVHSKTLSWEKSALQIEKAITQRLKDLRKQPSHCLNSNIKCKASVIIPSYNGGSLFNKVINAVLEQQVPWKYEILIIDSGSTDGTIEMLANKKGLILHQINKSEFGHGKTRNLGAKLSNGEFIAFITQDAMPANEYWLINLVSSLERENSAAGAFGKHIAYTEHSEFIKRDMINHFDGWIDQNPHLIFKNTDILHQYENNQNWQRLCHFYSDNNSCMRRSVWEKIPYQDVEFGEDQIWAREIIEAGYGKLYVDDAVVVHSHEYNFRETLKRSKTEAIFFKNYFNTNLCENKAQAYKMIEETNNRDKQYAIEHKISEKELENRKKMNFARICGFYLASKQR